MPYNPDIHHRRAVRLKGYDYTQAGLYFITICTRVGTRHVVSPNKNTVTPNVGTQHVVSLPDNPVIPVGTSHVMSLHGTTRNPVSPHHPFGKIVDGEMILNDVGKIADEYLQNIPDHFPHSEIGEYVVMPNHVHCILMLHKPSVGTSHVMSSHAMSKPENTITTNTGTRNVVVKSENPALMHSGTRHVVSLPDNPEIPVGTSHVMSLQQPNVAQPPSQKKLNQFSKPIPGSVSVIVQQYKSSVKRWCNKHDHPEFQWQSRFHDHIIRNAKSYENISQYIINNPKTWMEDKFYSE
ncbi:MAG TPA: hypothetical protein VI757_01570 [Bacteroidia bacterium]|nr:hypothetical protein [Bacteroidia bacterium]